jgi:hypothetical protein
VTSIINDELISRAGKDELVVRVMKSTVTTVLVLALIVAAFIPVLIVQEATTQVLPPTTRPPACDITLVHWDAEATLIGDGDRVSRAIMSGRMYETQSVTHILAANTTEIRWSVVFRNEAQCAVRARLYAISFMPGYITVSVNGNVAQNQFIDLGVPALNIAVFMISVTVQKWYADAPRTDQVAHIGFYFGNSFGFIEMYRDTPGLPGAPPSPPTPACGEQERGNHDGEHQHEDCD